VLTIQFDVIDVFHTVWMVDQSIKLMTQIPMRLIRTELITLTSSLWRLKRCLATHLDRIRPTRAPSRRYSSMTPPRSTIDFPRRPLAYNGTPLTSKQYAEVSPTISNQCFTSVLYSENDARPCPLFAETRLPFASLSDAIHCTQHPSPLPTTKHH